MSYRLYLALISLSLAWGGSFYFFKVLVADFSPITVPFLRSTVGAITLLILLPFQKQVLGIKKLPLLPIFLVGVLNTSIPWTLISYSEQNLTSNVASVLNATTPLWTIVIGIFLFGVKSSRIEWIGLFIGFIGILILTDIHSTLMHSIDLISFFSMLMATLCYGLSIHLTRRYLMEVPMFQIALCTLLVGTISGGIATLCLEPIQIFSKLSWNHLWPLVGIGTFGSGFAYLLFFYMIQKGSPNFAAMSTYLVPVTAIFWGYTLLQEEINLSLILGLILILVGVYVSSHKSRKEASTDTVQESV